jgi:trans-2,3-dihydro-3-hydroxyanthranilate isomerase
VTGNEVQLSTETQHNESEINSNLYSLENFLTEMGLEIGDVTPDNEGDIIWPTFLNTSIARTKTIIPICSLERLHAATPPLDPIKFATMCDMINSTGIYLYSTAIKRYDDNDIKTDTKREIVFECRQFPKSSGYSEDPATGIAAGALGASLRKRQIMSNKSYNEDSNNYVIYQGTAMNRPSKIQVNICGSNTSKELKVLYTGLVAFDTISISDIA